jgi:membrane-associated protease RseP (regulator of RpoE activity)
VVPRLPGEELTEDPELPPSLEKISASRWAVHGGLLALTLVTTTLVGVVLAEGFGKGQPIDLDSYLSVFPLIAARPGAILEGFAFSLTLLAILLSHELGHYFACRYYRIDATLPYFLPAPTPIGTLGAFIRIHSPIYSRRALFDVGIAGPLAGFIVLVPALAVGVAMSKVIPGIALQGDLIFGVPLIQRLMESLFFPGVRSVNVLLHPIARAAWVGTLATALNLLPIGQLDGGHILYAFAGTRHKLLSRLFVVVLLVLGIFYSRTWLVWAVLLFFFALRHPSIYDLRKIGNTRVLLGIAAAVILVLTFTLIPIR